MQISGLTICVDYSDLLEKSIDTWAKTLDRLVIVSNLDDSQTVKLAWPYRHSNIELFRTNVFYENGAIFNKSLAICEAMRALNWGVENWCMFFDADIVPPHNWRQVWEAQRPDPEFMYGAHRWLENGEPILELEMAGWFQIFHSSNPNVQRRPLLQTDWKHAGGYDSEFHQRWREHQKVWLPLHLIHQGMHGENWFGRGQKEQMEAMLNRRKEIGVIAPQEKIQCQN